MYRDEGRRPLNSGGSPGNWSQQGKFLFWTFVALCSLPFWLTEYVPLVDLPFHVARTHLVLEHLQDPAISSIYYLDLSPIPNLGVDLLMAALLGLLDVKLAVPTILTLILIMFAVGVRKTLRALTGDEYNSVILLAPFLIFNSMFIYGFVNYTLGLGLFFWSWGYWYEHRSGFSPLQFVRFAALAIACYFAHLSSYVFLLVAVVLSLLFDRTSGRREVKLLTAVPVFMPIAIFIAFMRGSGSNSGMEFASIGEKIITSLALVTSYDITYDAFNLMLIGLIALSALIVAKRREWRSEGLVLGISFFIAFLLSPKVLFTSYAADARLVPVFVVFLIGSVSLVLSRRWSTVLGIAILSVYFVRTIFITYHWSQLSDRMESHAEVMDRLPDSSRVLPLFIGEEVYDKKLERPMEHVLSYGIISKGLMTASFIAKPGQQPIVYKQQPLRYVLHPGTTADTLDLDALEFNYDYIWGYKLAPNFVRALDSIYPKFAHQGDLHVYDLKRKREYKKSPEG